MPGTMGKMFTPSYDGLVKVRIVNFLGLCGATFLVGLIGMNFVSLLWMVPVSFSLLGLSIGLFLLLNSSN